MCKDKLVVTRNNINKEAITKGNLKFALIIFKQSKEKRKRQRVRDGGKEVVARNNKWKNK